MAGGRDKPNITYIIGAGASADAIPIVGAAFNERF